jgi:hypothetical protein
MGLSPATYEYTAFRADGLKIDRIPLTRHAAWSAKFEK